MKLSASLTVILVISVITIILFPIFTVLFQYPMFQKILTENILSEGVSLATNLSSVLTIEAADILRESYRDSDIIARVGGDEFAVLMAERDDISRDVLTSRLKENLDMHQSRQSRTYELSISVGTALYDPENPSSLDELMISADRLMYENKRRTKRSRRR